MQFDDVHTLTNALAFYSVVAWQLLTLTYALRQNPAQSAETIFESAEVTLLKQISRKSIGYQLKPGQYLRIRISAAVV